MSYHGKNEKGKQYSNFFVFKKNKRGMDVLFFSSQSSSSSRINLFIFCIISHFSKSMIHDDIDDDNNYNM